MTKDLLTLINFAIKLNEEERMTLCCQKCPYWGTCETKWYRGERGEEQLCCDKCESFAECNPKPPKKPVRSGKNKRR
jgi:hypothetical protein